MLAVHAFWSARDGLCLWAEDSAKPVKSNSQAVRSARPHPFAASAHTLAAMADGLGVDGVPGTALLVLPSLPTAPLDSPDLVRLRPRPEPTRQPALITWSVPVLCVDAASASAGLDQPSEWEFDTDVRLGATIRFIVALADFARDLAERGRVLPCLSDEGDDTFAARWRPVIQGPDVAVIQALVTALPPVCRAETISPGELRGRDPRSVVSQALGGFVDAIVRQQLADVSSAATLAGIPSRRKPRAGEEATEAWLAALGAPDGRFCAAPADAERLADALAAWDGFSDGEVGMAHATFRLVEVEDNQAGDDAAAWRLEFWLQSVTDPSLLVAAAQVWADTGGLGRWLERPDQLLLAELGRASSIYPEMSGALRQARPEALELDAAAVVDFLSHRAGLLDQAGFGVLLPSWWTRRRRLSLKGAASPQQVGGITDGMFSREALCRFDWRLAIGDEPLTEDELQTLADTKAPLVRLRGEWVPVDQEQLRRGLEFIQRWDERGAASSVAAVIALASSHPDDIDAPLPVSSVTADGWLGELLAGTISDSVQPVEPPPDFQASLRPYQQRGLAWLAFLNRLGLGACLADDMGLGKTVQLLALESHLRVNDPDALPTLLLCPMSLVGNWEREAAKFAPALRVYAHHGPGRARGEDLDACLAAADIVITTYHTAHRDMDDLAGRTWARVVADEAQAIKNERTRISKAARRLQATGRIALTGTPMENKLAELWSIMDFLNPGMLGSAELFRTRYARPIERHGQTEPSTRLRTITRPYILRRLKTDPTIICDLPEKMEIKAYCNLTTEQASLYQSVVGEMMGRIEASTGIERRGNVLAAMTKLKQVCNHPAQFLHDGSAVGRRSGKVNHLGELLTEILDAGEKVLLFTQYTGFAELLLPHLSAQFAREISYLHGQTPKTRRDEMVQRFQSGDAGSPPIFLLSLKAGGTGLNLTAANHVIHLDRWWNPAVENQATDRAYRIGQRRNVQVRKFICVGTLEEKIDEMIEQKKQLADLVVGDGEDWLTDLSTQELERIFTLSQGAVGE